MMLKQYYGKNVVIEVNGQVIKGFVDDYFYPEDNENGEESIILKTSDSDFIEITQSDIDNITVN